MEGMLVVIPISHKVQDHHQDQSTYQILQEESQTLKSPQIMIQYISDIHNLLGIQLDELRTFLILEKLMQKAETLKKMQLQFEMLRIKNEARIGLNYHFIHVHLKEVYCLIEKLWKQIQEAMNISWEEWANHYLQVHYCAKLILHTWLFLISFLNISHMTFKTQYCLNQNQ